MSKSTPLWQDYFGDPKLRREQEQSAWNASRFPLCVRTRQRLTDADPGPAFTIEPLGRIFVAPYGSISFVPYVLPVGGEVFARHERACFHYNCPDAPPLEMGGTKLCRYPCPREEP